MPSIKKKGEQGGGWPVVTPTGLSHSPYPHDPSSCSRARIARSHAHAATPTALSRLCVHHGPSKPRTRACPLQLLSTTRIAESLNFLSITRVPAQLVRPSSFDLCLVAAIRAFCRFFCALFFSLFPFPPRPLFFSSSGTAGGVGRTGTVLLYPYA